MEEMCSIHFGQGKDGKPWTETVVVVKPGASDEEIQVAAGTAKRLAAQFSEEVERAKADSESLAARLILALEPKQVYKIMNVEFAGSCAMPIGKFGDAQFPGKTVAEVYEEVPKAVQWVGFDKASEMLKDAGADRVIGIVACTRYWNEMDKVTTGLSKPGDVLGPNEAHKVYAQQLQAEQGEYGYGPFPSTAGERVGKDPSELVRQGQQQEDDYGQVEDDERDLSEPLESEDDWL